MAFADNKQKPMPIEVDRSPGRYQTLAYPEAALLTILLKKDSSQG